MGGSSLGPEVIRRSYGKLDGGLELHVLDSTDPGAVRALEAAIDVEKTIFIVSSKSGGTVETLSHMKHFYELTGGNGDQFVAVTDPGSGLVDMAGERGFRRVFENDPDIGGRYSVMSYFGLVPAALAGVDVAHMCRSAAEAAERVPRRERRQPGLAIGVMLGTLALEGKNKATFVVSPRIAAFGLWAEQLIAESTGKQGRGILPVADEPLTRPDFYGDDRVFVYLRDADAPDAGLDGTSTICAGPATRWSRSSTPGRRPGPDLLPVRVRHRRRRLGAGHQRVRPAQRAGGQGQHDKVLEADQPPQVEEADDAALSALLGHAAPPHYVAIMGYVPPTDEFDDAVLDLRRTIRDATRATTTFGYGPRFLHSTGQFHKGGPPEGLFLQLTHDPGDDVAIPDADFGFAELIAAQATGDVLTLRDHGLPAERVVLEGDPAVALRALTEKVREMLAD